MGEIALKRFIYGQIALKGFFFGNCPQKDIEI